MTRLIVSLSSNVNSGWYVQDEADIDGFLIPPVSFALPASRDYYAWIFVASRLPGFVRILVLVLGLSSMGFRLRQSILSSGWTQFHRFS